MTEKPVRIAMWSGPRNISTAMMRAFENRHDTVVIDEPFYACYLKATGLGHPGRDLILKEQPTSWQAVVADLMAPLPRGKMIFYQKHMCHHMVPGIGLEWMADMRHAFLIRNPRHMVTSYVKARAQVTAADLGFARLLELFERVTDNQGHAPPVVDSIDVLAAPRETLSRLCEALAIPFDPAMLAWPKGRRDTDGVWAPWWYAGVEKSTGFDAPDPASRDADYERLDDAVKAIAEAAMPIYDRMRRYAL